MLTMGDLRRTHLTGYGPDGVVAECVTYDQDLFRDAYIAELADFTDCVRRPRPRGHRRGRARRPVCRPRRHPVGHHRRAGPA
jgi:hypothetical protein